MDNLQDFQLIGQHDCGFIMQLCAYTALHLPLKTGIYGSNSSMMPASCDSLQYKVNNNILTHYLNYKKIEC